MSFFNNKSIYPNITDVQPGKNRSTQVYVENSEIATQVNQNTHLLTNGESNKYKKLKHNMLVIFIYTNILFMLAGITTLITDRKATSDKQKFYYIVLGTTIVTSLVSYVIINRYKKYYTETISTYIFFETFVFVLLFMESMLVVGIVYKYFISDSINNDWKVKYPLTYWYLISRGCVNLIHLFIFAIGYIYMLYYFVRIC